MPVGLNTEFKITVLYENTFIYVRKCLGIATGQNSLWHLKRISHCINTVNTPVGICSLYNDINYICGCIYSIYVSV